MTYAVLGVVGLVALFAGIERNARLMLVLWFSVVGFVPFWAGVLLPVFLPAVSIVGILTLLFFAPGSAVRLRSYDYAVLAFAGICLVAGLAGVARPGDVTMVLTQWVTSYFVARILIDRTGLEYLYRIASIVFTIVAVATIIEFNFDWNPYFSWIEGNAQYDAWGRTQMRGGVDRAEWAFGHSIALGCSLAMVLPLIAAANFRLRTRVALFGLCSIAIVYTFSRSGILTGILAALMVVVVYRGLGSVRARFGLVVGFGIAAWFSVPLISSVFEADKGLATTSSDYRGRLTGLIQTMNPFGLASGFQEASAGVYSFSGFKSIDSTFVFIGVSFGYIAAAIALLGISLLALTALYKRTSPAGIAVAAVLPALFTVAPITQFGCLLFFYVGAAAMTVWGSPALAERIRTRDRGKATSPSSSGILVTRVDTKDNS